MILHDLSDAIEECWKNHWRKVAYCFLLTLDSWFGWGVATWHNYPKKINYNNLAIILLVLVGTTTIVFTLCTLWRLEEEREIEIRTHKARIASLEAEIFGE